MKISLILLSTVAALCLTGCVGPRPTMPAQAHITPPADWRSPGNSGDAAIDQRWWQDFGDPVLSSLVDEALAHNDDIAMAAQRVEEARAQFAIAHGSRLPQVDAGAAGGRSRGLDAFGVDVDQWAGQGEVEASFDLDLFGRLKNTEAAGRARLLASGYAHDTVRLAVVRSLVSGYVQLRAADARVAILQRTLTAREASLHLIRRRADTGYGSQLDLAQAQAEYEATAQAIPPAQLAVTKLENGLSILIGRPPATLIRGVDLIALTVPTIPRMLPWILVRRRPDLAAAEQRIVAADRTLDAARAAMMPDVRLAADGGFVATSLIPGNPQSMFSLGGSLLAPVFTGGRLRAQAQGAAASRDEAAFAYRDTVLNAFRQVEDAMASVSRLDAQDQALGRERDALARSQDLATHRYREGYSPYLDQLDAERSLLSVQLALVQTRADRLTASVDLYQALGGGWQHPFAGLARSEP